MAGQVANGHVQHPLKATHQLRFVAHSGEAVGSVAWVGRAGPTLLTGNASNTELKLWACQLRDTPRCLQTLHFASGREQPPFNQLLVQPAAELVLLGDSRYKRLYAVHIRGGEEPDSQPVMDYIVTYAVAMPILSMTAEHNADKLALFCVQTGAIQQFVLDIQACQPLLGTASRQTAHSEAAADGKGPDDDQVAADEVPAEGEADDLPSTVSAAMHKAAGADNVEKIGADAGADDEQPLVADAEPDAGPSTSQIQADVLFDDGASTEPQFSGGSLDARLPESLTSASITPAKRSGSRASTLSASPAKRTTPEPSRGMLPPPRWPDPGSKPADASPFAGILPPVSTPSAATSQQPRLLTPTQLMLAAKAAASRSPSVSSMLSESMVSEGRSEAAPTPPPVSASRAPLEAYSTRKDSSSREAHVTPTTSGIRFQELHTPPVPPMILQRPKPPGALAEKDVSEARDVLSSAAVAGSGEERRLEDAHRAPTVHQEPLVASNADDTGARDAAGTSSNTPDGVKAVSTTEDVPEEKVDVTLSVLQPPSTTGRAEGARAEVEKPDEGPSVQPTPSSAPAHTPGTPELLLRLEALHKKLEKQVSGQATLAKGVQQELRKETKRLETAMEAQV